ncbi:MAG TPA: peptidoglycan DD-metalloendopeptidase family protein [Candidatus Paceibacterota bacterium]|nr:peptidoglycan DD-metalloendopeptidase family protein [Candidatus Paceibacterota bacterium]
MKEILKNISVRASLIIKQGNAFVKSLFGGLIAKGDRRLKEQLVLVLFLMVLLIPGEIIYKSVITKSYQFNDTEANTSRNATKAYPQYIEDISHSALYYFSQSAMASDSELAEMAANSASPANSNFIVYDGGFLDNNASLTGNNGSQLNRREVMTYVVKDGDTPGKIASEFGISLNTLVWANNLKNGNLIKPGQELIILPVSGIQYQVKSGDTLGKIASTYKVDANKIKDFNGLSGDTLIKGDTLIIPDGKLVSVTAVLSSSQGSEIKNTDIVSSKNSYFIPPTTGWNWGELHPYNAVDFANRCGTPVYAAADGIVTLAIGNNAWNSGYGNYIKIQHPNGALTLYAHLSVVSVKDGQSVTQGQVIGAIGNTGNVTGPTGCHLHFEVRGMTNPFAK